MRCPVGIATAAIVAAYAIEFVCVIYGWYVWAFGAGTDTHCQPIRSWHLQCCSMLTFAAFSFGIWGPAAVVWAIRGMFVRASLPEPCRHEERAISSYIDVLFEVGCLVATFFFSALLICALTRWLVRRFHTWVASEAVRRLVNAPSVQVDQHDECCICCQDGSELVDENGESYQWRRLPCDHVFHLHCLVDWFYRKRECPLCRRSLEIQELYSENVPATPAPLPPTPPVVEPPPPSPSSSAGRENVANEAPVELPPVPLLPTDRAVQSAA